MSDALGFVVLVLVFVLIFTCIGVFARRSYVRRQRSLELHAPLLNSEDRRLDAALRDAEEGFNVCQVCGFENFKRFRFCIVCGEAIRENPDTNGDRDSSTETDKKKSLRLSLLPLFKRDNRVQLATSQPLPSQQQPSRRRLRAQRRKEWTRKMDVEGRMFWFRDGRCNVDTRCQGFVVKLQSSGEVSEGPDAAGTGSVSPPDEVPIPEPDQEDDHALEGKCSPTSAVVPPPTIGSVEDRIASLQRGVEALRVKFVPAGDSDASKLPLDAEISSSQALHDERVEATTMTSTSTAETMTLSSKDFPSRYAHFVTSAAAILVPPEREHFRLNVDRTNLFSDSMESLAIIPSQNVHSVLRINFLDESGVDAGGLHREWFAMLNEMLVDPKHGLFVCLNKNEQTYFLTPCSHRSKPRQLLHLFAVGRLLGRALLEGSMMSFHLAPPLLKLILGHPLSFADVEDLDPEMYISLLWLLENQDVDTLELDFTVTVKDGEGYRDVELVPGGSEISVTDSNKHDYVERKWKFLMVESITPQIAVFLQGLYEIVPRELLLLFDPAELDFLLCGSDEIDVDDWERNTKYTEELHQHRALIWFWELVREMPNEYRRRLLQFATGSSRVPLGGFSALTSYDGRLCPFTLKAVTLVGDGFIHGHACFNRLDLPLHVVRDELKAVLYAAVEMEVYGFTTD
ncbi:hypothetical protein PHYBOEH_002375 [Phytophthora boehmeriae]|uniref:HECT-type E3 ubiquitin transferase n=1 Tax=Phytophthora boehmeriae TaxID=109152 RepID=A0A8T1X6A5_9STRA|nr:hypothetical protein PHYBOEH_002375 [Phytophthora boehmeriae]